MYSSSLEILRPRYERGSLECFDDGDYHIYLSTSSIIIAHGFNGSIARDKVHVPNVLRISNTMPGSSHSKSPWPFFNSLAPKSPLSISTLLKSRASP